MVWCSPLRTVQRRVSGNRKVSMIYVSAVNEVATTRLKDSISLLMRERRRVPTDADENFSVRDLKEISELIERLKKEYPSGNFIQMNLPPLAGLNDNSFDYIVSFQVIEHIKDDSNFLKEIHRVLKPGGRLAISDVVATAELPQQLRNDPMLLSGCMAGASLVEDLEDMISGAGMLAYENCQSPLK